MDDQIARAVALLKAHGFRLSVEGCGCCESPWVRLEHDGQNIIGDASGDIEAYGVQARDQVNFDMFQEAPIA